MNNLRHHIAITFALVSTFGLQIASANASPEEESSIGIGVGYRFQNGATDEGLSMPDTVSLRLRHSSGFTLEAQLLLARWSTTNKTTTNETSETNVAVAVAGRFPLIERSNVTLEAIAQGIWIQHRGQADLLDVDLAAGIGLDYALTKHWHASLTTTGSVIRFSRYGGDNDWAFGPAFDLTATAMVHLFL